MKGDSQQVEQVNDNSTEQIDPSNPYFNAQNPSGENLQNANPDDIFNMFDLSGEQPQSGTLNQGGSQELYGMEQQTQPQDNTLYQGGQPYQPEYDSPYQSENPYQPQNENPYQPQNDNPFGVEQQNPYQQNDNPFGVEQQNPFQAQNLSGDNQQNTNPEASTKQMDPSNPYFNAQNPSGDNPQNANPDDIFDMFDLSGEQPQSGTLNQGGSQELYGMEQQTQPQDNTPYQGDSTDMYGQAPQDPYQGEQPYQPEDDFPYQSEDDLEEDDLYDDLQNPYQGDPQNLSGDNQQNTNPETSTKQMDPSNPYFNAQNPSGDNPQNANPDDIFDMFDLSGEQQSTNLPQDNTPYQGDSTDMYGQAPQDPYQGEQPYQPEDDSPYQGENPFQQQSDNPYQQNDNPFGEEPQNTNPETSTEQIDPSNPYFNAQNPSGENLQSSTYSNDDLREQFDFSDEQLHTSQFQNDSPYQQQNDSPYQGENPYQQQGDNPFGVEQQNPYQQQNDSPYQGENPYQQQSDNPFGVEQQNTNPETSTEQIDPSNPYFNAQNPSGENLQSSTYSNDDLREQFDFSGEQLHTSQFQNDSPYQQQNDSPYQGENPYQPQNDNPYQQNDNPFGEEPQNTNPETSTEQIDPSNPYFNAQNPSGENLQSSTYSNDDLREQFDFSDEQLHTSQFQNDSPYQQNDNPFGVEQQNPYQPQNDSPYQGENPYQQNDNPFGVEQQNPYQPQNDSPYQGENPYQQQDDSPYQGENPFQQQNDNPFGVQQNPNQDEPQKAPVEEPQKAPVEEPQKAPVQEPIQNPEKEPVQKAENKLRSKYEAELRKNVEIIRKNIPDFKFTEDDINEYLSDENLKLVTERSEENSFDERSDQNRDTVHKYLSGGIAVSMFKRNGMLLAKPENSAENIEYNEDLYEDLNRNDARGWYAKKKFYAELLNQLVDFHENELTKIDPKLHTPQEIAGYCRNNALKGNLIFELVAMGGTTEATRALLPKDAEQLRALTDYAQVIGGYMQGVGELAQSDYYVTFPHRNMDVAQLSMVAGDFQLPDRRGNIAAKMIPVKSNELALSDEIKTFNEKFTHGRYTVDDFNENPTADDLTMITGGFAAHKEALMEELRQFEQLDTPYVGECTKELNDLKGFLQTRQSLDQNEVMQLKEKADAFAGAIQKIRRNHTDLPENFKLASDNMSKHVFYFNDTNRILAALRQDEQDALRDAAMEHGFAAGDAEIKEWFRQYKYDMRMSGQENMLPKSSDLKAIREVFNKKYIEHMQTTPEYAQLKEKSLKKLKHNITEIKKMLPDFDLTEEQIEKCLSPEKLCIKLMSIKNPPKPSADPEIIKSFLPGGNVFPQYARSYFNVIRTDGTPEAEEYNKALMFDTQRLDKKGVEARKDLSCHMFNTIKNVDIGILNNKDDMSVESLSYCLYNDHAANLAWEVFGIFEGNKEFVPKDPGYFEDLKKFGQGTGAYVWSVSEMITSDNFLCMPHEYLNLEQIGVMMGNLKNPIYNDIGKLSNYIFGRENKSKEIKTFTDKHSLARPITKDDFTDGPGALKEEFDYNKIKMNVLSAMAKFPMDKTYPKAPKFASEIAKVKEDVQTLYKAFSSDIIPDEEDLKKIVEVGTVVANWGVNSPKLKDNPELREFINDFAPIYNAMHDCKSPTEIMNLAEYQKKDLPEMLTYKNVFKAQAQNEAAFIEECANTLDEIDSAFISSSQKFKDLKAAFKSLKSFDENVARLGYKNNLVMMKKRKDLMQDLSDKSRDYAIYKTKEALQRRAEGKTPLSDYAAKRLDFARKVADIAGKQAVDLDINVQIARNLINPNKTREEKQAYIASAENIRTQKLDAIDNPVLNAEPKKLSKEDPLKK